MKDLLKKLFKKYSIEYTEESLEKLDKFYNMVVETNQKFNLTAITAQSEFAIKHILDSVLCAKLLPANASVIDVGAGAGFPSVPLKILRPDLNITMLDSLNKRVLFLQDVISALNLKDICAKHERAEDYALKNREKFDVAIARAVANLTTLSEYCLPFVKLNGIFVALKGANLNQELLEAEYAIDLLGGKMESVQEVFVEEIDSKRENIVIKKIKQTPNKYPRGKNLPRLKPLCKWLQMAMVLDIRHNVTFYDKKHKILCCQVKYNIFWIKIEVDCGNVDNS